ncbi:unnamed protein product [Adineta steineri]|uniref:F-box domain-containing protein n=2 Tax=Adineta steineri TaxID=433720 RepID=A0A819TE73_9BILA|nr:unnamed protein product [Adineta steineri]
MNTDSSSTLFEQFPVELIRSIFEYLSPLDLLNAFEELNSRFSSIIREHPLCLPNNRRMSLNVYEDYMEYVLPEYSSQIVYLHLSEHRTPHAVDSFFNKMYDQKYLFSKLKAITIQDIPFRLYDSLLDDILPLFNKLESLTIDLNADHYHHSDYNQWTDIDFLVPILNSFPQLCSLYLKISPVYDKNYLNDVNMISSSMSSHMHLHTLSIDQCSRQLFVELLSKNRLPKLRNLRIKFPQMMHNKHVLTMQSHQIPLNTSCVPQLRCIKLEVHTNIQWILDYFEEIYRSEQLEELIIHGYVRFSEGTDFPRADIVRKWLAMSKLKQCNVRFHFSVTCREEIDQQNLNDLFANYMKIFGRNSIYQNTYILIHYPNNIKSLPNEDEEDDIGAVDELEIDESDYLEDEWIETVQNVSHWPNLRKISILGDCTKDKDAINRNFPILLHVARRAIRFCELEIEATLAFGLALSSNIELCKYLADHLEVLRFNGEDRTSSFLQLVQVVDTIYSHSSSSSLPLKKLTIFVDAKPASWLTIEHFQKGLQLVFNRFPSLIHFTLYCCQIEQFTDTIYNLNELLSDWSSGVNCGGSWSWRSQSNSFDLWL